MSATARPECRVPDCDQILHPEGTCTVDLITALGSQVGYVAFVSPAEDEPHCLDIYGDVRAEISDPLDALDLANRLRLLAEAVERGAGLLRAASAAAHLAA